LKNEYSEEIEDKSEKDEGPPLNVNTEKQQLLNELEDNQVIKEDKPEIQEEKVIEPIISHESNEFEKEESKPVEEKPPMFFSIPKQNPKAGEKPKMSSPFVTHKPNPSSTIKPFINTSHVTSTGK